VVAGFQLSAFSYQLSAGKLTNDNLPTADRRQPIANLHVTSCVT
jgi:hypothetical protein